MKFIAGILLLGIIGMTLSYPLDARRKAMRAEQAAKITQSEHVTLASAIVTNSNTVKEMTVALHVRPSTSVLVNTNR